MWESKRATSLLPAGWMAAVSLTVAALTVATAVSASPVEVLIGRGDVLAPFAMSGGELNLSTATVPWSGLPFLNLSYDFTKGGWGANLSPEDHSLSLSHCVCVCVCVCVLSSGGWEDGRGERQHSAH